MPKWCLVIMWLVATVVLVFGSYGAIRLYNYYYNIGVSISVSPKDNIKKLDSMQAQNGSSSVVLKTDSVLGVALNIYELHNVKAELTLVELDTADHSVLMYTRTADYTAMGKYIGSLVVDGEQKRSDASRLGYCAIAKGNMVIGISRFDDMCEHMVERDGSYFRQFVLVSNGELLQRFLLHGKVETQSPCTDHGRPPLHHRDSSPRNTVGLRRCFARIWLCRCYLSYRWQRERFLSCSRRNPILHGESRKVSYG